MGYGRQWQKFRKMILAQRPICEGCHRAPATEVDHVAAVTKGAKGRLEEKRGKKKEDERARFRVRKPNENRSPADSKV